MTTYFIFTGEVSGDLHGSKLIQALHQNEKQAAIFGVGGPRMRREAFQTIIPMEEFQVMGFTDVIRSLPRLIKLFYRVRNAILKQQPDCVILIDYPGFNLRLAKSLRKSGFKGKIVQYICPTVWAHGKERIQTLENYFDLLLTIYPFESELFAHTRLKVVYVGNPLVETIAEHSYQKHWLEQNRLPINRELIALFPGSRLSEVQRHLPVQLSIAEGLKKRDPTLHFAVSCGHESLRQWMIEQIEKSSLILNEEISFISPGQHYDLMKHCKTALAKSGTVTLELALHSVPTVVHYEVSLLNYLFARFYLKLSLPNFCIVNILNRKTLFPEFVGRILSSEQIKEELERLHFDPPYHLKIQKGCKTIQEILGSQSTHQLAVKAIEDLLQC